MRLIPHRSFWDLDKLFTLFDELRLWREEDWPEEWFQRTPVLRAPKMDIYEDNGNIIAEVELPGMDPKNIDIEVKDNALKIEAKSEEKKEEKRKGYYRKELSAGYYKRTVPLPLEVIGEKTEAVYKEGILKITIPKVKPAKEKEKKGTKIKVKIK